MYGFSHQFPMTPENTTEPVEWGNPRKLILILFPQDDCFFPLDSHPRHTSSYGKCMCFHINLPQHRKMQRNPLIWENLGNWYSYFPKVFSQNQNPMVYFITWETDDFCSQFPITQENAAKTTLRYRYPYFFQKKATFLPSNSRLMVFYITSEMHGFSHPFFIAWENSSKILSYDPYFF